MDYNAALGKLEQSDVYLDWREHHAEAYLTHFFSEINTELKLGSWQIGYYEEENDRLSTFLVGGVIELGNDDFHIEAGTRCSTAYFGGDASATMGADGDISQVFWDVIAVDLYIVPRRFRLRLYSSFK